ncbi:MAG: CHAT domain-containing protein [Armatimonadetes bacterium]|nr:CHAT domain-containing protein [Armatimonadota bacterium]
MSITSLVLILSLISCLSVRAFAQSIPPLKPLGEPPLREDIARPQISQTQTPRVPLPDTPVHLPRSGQKDSFGVKVTPDLEIAYRSAFLGGDGRSLEAIERLEKTLLDDKGRWLVSALRAQTYLRLGRAADAEIELEETSRREIRYMGTNVYSRALRGEVRLWLADYEGAVRDLAQVAEAMGSWRIPTEYSSTPARLDLLVAVSTAQLRAFTALAGAYLLQGNHQAARAWAEEAEKGFNDVHSLPVRYGPYVTLFADSYYGRASNLAFLAAARMSVSQDPRAGDAFFEEIRNFYKANSFPAGQVTTDALRSRALLDMQRLDEAESLARSAGESAAILGLSELVWRVEGLRGEALLALGRKQEAETAFRRAQAAIETASGALSTDRAKLRFGVGKEEIANRLIGLDVEKEDFAALFRDLERSRARAFVDMLSGQALPQDRQPEAVREIRDLDRQILELRLRNSAPGAGAETREKESRLTALRAEKIQTLRARDPDIADALTVSSLEITDLQARLARGEVMAYFLPARSEEPLRVLLVTRDSARLKKLAILSDELSSLLKALRGAIILGDAGEQKAAAKALDNALKVESWGGATSAYVVPSGKAHFIPWGVLETTFPVSVLPTAMWLNRPPFLWSPQKKAVVLGDPELGGVMPQLPQARAEAMEVAQLYRSTPLLGEQATETALRADAGTGVEVLHMATHGTFDPRNPLLSAMILSDGTRAAHLTASKLYASPLRARFVVLSACETGLGQVVAGEDLLGLIRSFYLGGTLTLLSSQWRVEDRGTRLFMETFHKLAAQGDYGAAWLKTRDLLKKQGFSPAVYGAFVLGGILRR